MYPTVSVYEELEPLFNIVYNNNIIVPHESHNEYCGKNGHAGGSV